MTLARLQHDLADWQQAYASESIVRLTASAPPVTSQVQGDVVIVTEEPAAAIGMNLSAAAIRLLGHPEGYGSVYPTRRALHAWDRYCRSRHSRWYDHAGQPVCAMLAWMVIRDGFSILFASDMLGLSYPRAERLLVGALERMAEWQDRWQAQMMMKPQSHRCHGPDSCAQCREVIGTAKWDARTLEANAVA